MVKTHGNYHRSSNTAVDVTLPLFTVFQQMELKTANYTMNTAQSNLIPQLPKRHGSNLASCPKCRFHFTNMVKRGGRFGIEGGGKTTGSLGDGSPSVGSRAEPR